MIYAGKRKTGAMIPLLRHRFRNPIPQHMSIPEKKAAISDDAEHRGINLIFLK